MSRNVWEETSALPGRASCFKVNESRSLTDINCGAYTKVTGVESYTKVTGVQSYTKVTGVEPYTKVTGVEPYTKVTGVEPYTEVTDMEPYTGVTGVEPYIVVTVVASYTEVTGQKFPELTKPHSNHLPRTSGSKPASSLTY